MTSPEPHDEERRRYREFVISHSEECYRVPLTAFYEGWEELNRRFFAGVLHEPHLALDRTAPRSLCHCEANTGYGGTCQLRLNANLVFGLNKHWVVKAWPAPGSKKFVTDLLARLTVQQFVQERQGGEKPGYGPFGPKFLEQANRIGAEVFEVDPVVLQRGEEDEDDAPLANGWPHCVRPEGYYGDDVTAAAVKLACGGMSYETKGMVCAGVGLAGLQQYLWRERRNDEARRMTLRYLRWSQQAKEGGWPIRKRVEKGADDTDDSELGKVEVQPDWLTWQDGLIGRLAQSIYDTRCFADLWLLAFALKQAGCTDKRILRHLCAHMQHNRGCWVLRALLAGQKSKSRQTAEKGKS